MPLWTLPSSILTVAANIRVAWAGVFNHHSRLLVVSVLVVGTDVQGLRGTS